MTWILLATLVASGDLRVEPALQWLLYPEAAPEVRDRGLIFEQLACFAAAAADLDHFLELAPEDPGAADVRARLAAVRARIGPLH